MVFDHNLSSFESFDKKTDIELDKRRTKTYAKSVPWSSLLNYESIHMGWI